MPIILLTILASGIIFSFLLSSKKIFLFLSFGLMLIFFGIQYTQTQPTDFFHPTEMETVNQIHRIHQYPNYAFRLGHIIEERQESIIFFKLEKNFTDTFDLLLFPNSFLTLFITPFFIIGVFKSIKIHPKFTLILITLPILLFTLIGHQNSSGPICLYPIIFAYSLFSLFAPKNR